MTACQPGAGENCLNTLFFDPCEFGQTCSGPGGILRAGQTSDLRGPKAPRGRWTHRGLSRGSQ